MIDLHVHSTISDGMDTPKEIIQKAKIKGLTAIALTDHDCIDGLAEAETEAVKQGILFVKGIEFSVTYGYKRQLHILGLGIHPEEDGFKKAYKAYRERKHNLIQHTIKGLNKINIYPKESELYDISTDGYLDRQSVAKWLLINGYTTSMQSSWIDYVDHIPHVEGELIDMPTALNMIKSAGGKSFLAHYHKTIGLLGYHEQACFNILSELKKLGLDGLERYYSDYNKSHHQVIDQYAKEHGFIFSGGSDYHGSNRPSVDLGVGNGDLNVPDCLLDSILDQDTVVSY